MNVDKEGVITDLRGVDGEEMAWIKGNTSTTIWSNQEGEGQVWGSSCDTS